MNLFDFFILLTFGFGLIRGIFRGLISELFSILGVFLGFYLSYSKYNLLTSKFEPFLGNQTYVKIAAFMLIFLLTIFIVSIIASFVRYIMNLNQMGWVNRVFGAVFGLIKSYIVVTILLIVSTTLIPKSIPFISKSELSRYFVQVSEAAVNVVVHKIQE